MKVGRPITSVAIAMMALALILANPSFAATPAPTLADSSLAAINSVFRVNCSEQNRGGTAFLHRSGNLITNAHVVAGCPHPVIIMPDGRQILTDVIKSDDDVDLALLKPATPIKATPLPISSAPSVRLGSEISMWGFPAGYLGRPPMLTAGIIAGRDDDPAKSGMVFVRWVINGAINSGNSGSPVVDAHSGEVIGVAVSKVVPIPPEAMSALVALQGQQSGFMYNETMSDGSTKQVSEAQVVATFLDALRAQVQLVVGHAIILDDLRQFLSSAGVDP